MGASLIRPPRQGWVLPSAGEGGALRPLPTPQPGSKTARKAQLWDSWKGPSPGELTRTAQVRRPTPR